MTQLSHSNVWCAICGGPVASYNITSHYNRPKDCHKYDPDLVDPADVEWTNQSQILGYNPSAAANSKSVPKFFLVEYADQTRFYVSGPARIRRFLSLSSEAQQDPTLGDYGDVNEAQGSEFKSEALQFCYGARTGSNPLAALPETIIYAISEFLDNPSLLNLFFASWATFLSLRDSDSFWRKRIVTQLPYFTELHECLRNQSQGLESRDFRKIFLWAETASQPRAGVAKSMFPVANRRRIWKVCEQIESLYIREPRRQPTEQSYIRHQAVKSGVWIKGFVFHIYASSVLRPWQACSWNYSSCMGVTAYLTDGSEHTYGQDGQHLFKMPFAVAENMAIIGIQGTLTKVWVLQARTDGGEKPSEVPEARAHEGSCWNAKTYMFKNKETRYLRDRDDDGSIWPEQRWDTFEVDGRGGERIEEVKVFHGPYHDTAPTAIEVSGRSRWESS
uniref:F-box domain-containing protein n=1 Tax=Fusarium oxysporum (strain Fo5176) TaxID=660025 RepID=A0A0C4DI54_FUSOF